MGRYSTGSVTTGQARRIELSYLLKKKIIKKGHVWNGSISWTDGSSISIHSIYNDNIAFIELSYTTTDHATNEKEDYKYKIQLETIPSNLGKGEVVYFTCPVSYKRCRILYKCYGSEQWKAREAYRNRIYYESQIEPKSVRPYKYLFVENKLEELYLKAKKSHYRGVPTKTWQKINELNRKSDESLYLYSSFEKLLCGIK